MTHPSQSFEAELRRLPPEKQTAVETRRGFVGFESSVLIKTSNGLERQIDW